MCSTPAPLTSGYAPRPGPPRTTSACIGPCFFQWNAARFPTALVLDHAATMQAARIGSRHTYRATLRDLDAWSLLTYCPS